MELDDGILDLIHKYKGYFDTQFNLDIPSEELQASFLGQLLRTIKDPKCTALSRAEGLLISRSLTWDTNHFGYPVQKLEHLLFQDQNTADSLLREHQQNLKKAGVKYVFVRIPSIDILVQNALVRHKFELMIHKVMLRASLAELSNRNSRKIANRILVRKYQPSDEVFASALARESLRMNRFTNDYNVDQQKASDVYEHWVRQLISMSPDDILIAENNGVPCGMIALEDASKMYPALNQGLHVFGFVSLIAVNENSRGKGVGKALMAAAFDQCKQKGFKVIYANTGLQNLGSITMFQQSGFEIFSMVSEYRCWL